MRSDGKLFPKKPPRSSMPIQPFQKASARRCSPPPDGPSIDNDHEPPQTKEHEPMSLTVTMPQLGETVTEGTILSWAKQIGDSVVEDEVLVE
ncbi:MAG: biotin/lipoyl-containing protein, partial [Acidimicrobiia bacterium]